MWRGEGLIGCTAAILVKNRTGASPVTDSKQVKERKAKNVVRTTVGTRACRGQSEARSKGCEVAMEIMAPCLLGLVAGEKVRGHWVTQDRKQVPDTDER